MKLSKKRHTLWVPYIPFHPDPLRLHSECVLDPLAFSIRQHIVEIVYILMAHSINPSVDQMVIEENVQFIASKRHRIRTFSGIVCQSDSSTNYGETL